MTDQPSDQKAPEPRDSGWAVPVSKIKVENVPFGATNINVEGLQPVSALQGFGALWQKTYKIRLVGVDIPPAQVMRVWKENFPKFQPPENRFYPPMTGIKPGEVLFIEGKVPPIPGMPSIMPVSSGVRVIYVDDESFTIMTPEGFPESGWNTFSTYDEDGVTVAQIQSMARAADPLYELFFRFLGSSEQQEKTWQHVLTSLAAHFDVKGQVTMYKTCVDPRLQWSEAKNVWKNAAARTVFYKMAAPLRWVRNSARRSPEKH